jgi:predicted DNA-binding protein (MmcQ/YjbR family)
MNLELIREYCISKPYSEESFPFDQQTLVFKVGGKIFALMDVDNPDGLNVKCNPEKALELREKYQGILPGYHMNKKHWNTIQLFSDVPDSTIYECIDDSYQLVLNALPKRIIHEIENR